MRTQQEDSILDMGIQASPIVSWQLGQQLASFVAPLLLELDTLIDKRLVRTLLATLGVIIQFRNRPHGLLLSELGAYLMGADQAPAGTKRLSNLLRCSKWQHTIIEYREVLVGSSKGSCGRTCAKWKWGGWWW